MKNRFICGFIITLSISIISPAAWAQVFFPDPYPSTPTLGQGLFIPNEPGKSFHEARQNFLLEEVKIAATDIRKGAAYLKMEKAVVKKEMQDIIASSERELEKLAQDVENGTVESARELDAVFARAHQALAKSYITRATEAWATKDATQTGHYLKTAIAHFRSYLAWSGQKLDTATAASIRDCRALAGKLIHNAGYASEEVGKALKNVAKEIDKLASEPPPEKK
jgi:hypothetical protein